MALMVSIPAGIRANRASTENLTWNLSNAITQADTLIEEGLYEKKICAS